MRVKSKGRKSDGTIIEELELTPQGLRAKIPEGRRFEFNLERLYGRQIWFSHTNAQLVEFFEACLAELKGAEEEEEYHILQKASAAYRGGGSYVLKTTSKGDPQAHVDLPPGEYEIVPKGRSFEVVQKKEVVEDE